MKPTIIFLWIFIIACILSNMASWLTTMEAIAQRNYYKEKCLSEIVEKNVIIYDLTIDKMRLEAQSDVLLLFEYILPEVKRQDEIATINHNLREYLKGAK